MSIKTFLQNKLFPQLKEYGLPAVIYAENLIGGGFGETKKQVAIEFILSKLPMWAIPFKSLIKKLLSNVLDFVIESAVKKLHEIQEKTGILAA